MAEYDGAEVHPEGKVSLQSLVEMPPIEDLVLCKTLRFEGLDHDLVIVVIFGV
jgi:hypothetical protein